MLSDACGCFLDDQCAMDTFDRPKIAVIFGRDLMTYGCVSGHANSFFGASSVLAACAVRAPYRVACARCSDLHCVDDCRLRCDIW